MLRNKLKILISSALIAATLFAALTFLKKPIEAPKQINRIESNEQKIDYSQSIIEKLESINKLEITQAYLKQDITLKGKYDNFLFKNNKTITVKANGIYKLDLNDIYENIIIGIDEVTVLVSIDNDIIFHDFEYNTEKGLLVFYDIEVTPEEYENLLDNVKEQMKTKMYTETYISEVKKRAKEIITKEIQEVTNKYKVRVVFID